MQKVKNGPNKSLAKRIKKNHGLIEVMANDNTISKEKMKDIRKIAQNIDRVYTIETQRESTRDPTETLNPYLQKQLHVLQKERIPVMQRSVIWAQEKKKETLAASGSMTHLGARSVLNAHSEMLQLEGSLTKRKKRPFRNSELGGTTTISINTNAARNHSGLGSHVHAVTSKMKNSITPLVKAEINLPISTKAKALSSRSPLNNNTSPKSNKTAAKSLKNSVISEKLTSYVTSMTDSEAGNLKVDSVTSVSITPAGTVSRKKREKRKSASSNRNEAETLGSNDSDKTQLRRKSVMSSFKDRLIGNLVEDLRKKQKKRKRKTTGNSRVEKRCSLAPISFGTSFKDINEKNPQPRDMMIRNKSDFSFPVQRSQYECRTQTSMRNSTERDMFNMSAKNFFTQKSNSKQSNAVISGGIRRSK